MIKNHKKQAILSSLGTLLPLFAGLLFWDKLPDELATHFGIQGPDGWSGKLIAVVAAPLVMLAIQWLCLAFTAWDHKRRSQSEKVIKLVFWIMPVISWVSIGSV